MKRGNGILLHISSLPSKYGIGSLGRCAYDFVDALAKAGQSYWQVLPCTPTGYGDSPYQSISAFASNPYFIDIDLLIKEKLLSLADVQAVDFGNDARSVDYQKQFECKPLLLKIAYKKGIKKYKQEFIEYKYQNAKWLFDFSLFAVFKQHFDHKPYTEWDDDVKNREPAAMMNLANQYEQDIESVQFSQFLYHKQWQALKAYANKKGISIIGDIPIYAASDSVEAWAHKELFRADECIAGCPPDYFCEEGQLWGNPIYDWEYMRKSGYEWWVLRVAHCMKLYDITRIDHFRGFESYFCIPKGKTAKDGEWVKGPAHELFDVLKQRLGNLPIIAEDLGFLTPEVFSFLNDCGFPGTKVLQFAFDEQNSIYQPQNYPKNCTVYTGTHDNDTTKSWFMRLDAKTKKRLTDYIGKCTKEEIADKLIRLAMSSVADVCILPMQDLLNLGGDARMNYPSQAMGYWKWRLQEQEFSKSHINTLKSYTKTYGR
ncbi:MAG: 4-alpha-glucanotransferase [Christensenellaceae bacterium]